MYFFGVDAISNMSTSLRENILAWNIAQNFQKPGRLYFSRICDNKSTLEDAIWGVGGKTTSHAVEEVKTRC